ncbi:TPA: hypothetical protein ROY01_004944 [Bacillus toyonensis]|nr:hypothetical protein [Bacillus toyonensis]
MNFNVPFSRLATAIKLSTIPAKKEIKLKKTTGSEYPSIIQCDPNNNIPANIKTIENKLNFLMITPPNIILPF